MKSNRVLLSACVASLMAVAPAAAAIRVQRCIPGPPTKASYTWNFRKEANHIFENVQYDAAQAEAHAAKLQSFQYSPSMSWQGYADQLTQLRSEINKTGGRLCLLETIRRVVAPWQQKSIDRIASSLVLLANNTQDAIVYENNYQNRLWTPAFRDYTDNIYTDASNLKESVHHAVDHVKENAEYGQLRNASTTKTSS